MFQMQLALFYSYLGTFQVFALSSTIPLLLGRIDACTVEPVIGIFNLWEGEEDMEETCHLPKGLGPAVKLLALLHWTGQHPLPVRVTGKCSLVCSHEGLEMDFGRLMALSTTLSFTQFLMFCPFQRLRLHLPIKCIVSFLPFPFPSLSLQLENESYFVFAISLLLF